jgi:hypothetical protein
MVGGDEWRCPEGRVEIDMGPRQPLSFLRERHEGPHCLLAGMELLGLTEDALVTPLTGTCE